MCNLEPPVGVTGIVLSRIIETGHLVGETAVPIQIVRDIIAGGIQGIHDTVKVRVQKTDHDTVFHGLPLGCCQVVVAHGRDFTHVEPEEVVHVYRYRLLEMKISKAVGLQLHTVREG